ncbi:hypothetical protein [Kribbella speibonae]|uniref:Uncharacterized protein n=1 Tax=Kribbella speibonae TaxID=1572660 RepID=A0A4R0IFH4_9ACTN|nr:hypothetical protein [Kribbella speibonae]TCC30784.1 hypothetical protein E0H92_37350 [Kribbella speibonae]
MRLRVRDIVATLLLAAVVVPYIGYLVNGEMPLIYDVQAMASTGFFLGVFAFWVIRGGQGVPRLGRFEGGVAVLALVLYVLTVAFDAEILLAAFVGSLLLVFGFDLFGRPRQHLDGRR